MTSDQLLVLFPRPAVAITGQALLGRYQERHPDEPVHQLPWLLKRMEERDLIASTGRKVILAGGEWHVTDKGRAIALKLRRQAMEART